MTIEAEPMTASVLLDVSVTPLMWLQLQHAFSAVGELEGYSSINDLVVEAINKEMLRLQRGYVIFPDIRPAC